MLRHWIAFCALGLALAWPLAANAGAELHMRTLPDAQGMMQIELQVAFPADELTYQTAPNGECVAVVRVELLLRRADGTMPLKSRLRYTLQLDEARYAHEQMLRVVRRFPAPPGGLTAWVTVEQGGEAQTLTPQTVEILPPLASQWQLGQPLVLQAGAPSPRNELSPAQGELNWTSLLWTPESRPFVLRVLLHRLDNPEAAGDALRYVSVYQQQKVMEAQGGSLTPLAGTVPLVDLPPGPYLLEVLALGEERVLAVQRAPLRILWDDGPRLLNKPDSALRMLAPLVGRQTVERIQDPEEQRRFWQDFWARRSNSTPYATQWIEDWHLALKAALKRYAAPADGYPDDRAATYARLGPPDRVQETERGERWRYDALQLEFHFPR